MLRESYIALRKIATDKLGGVCKNCNTKNGLQLHHQYYAKDSIRQKVHNECGNQTVKRVKEAILHPERFALLCLSCHNSKEPRHKKIVSVSQMFENDKSEVN